MTIRTGEWYRVKDTRQYCLVQRIPSTTDPRVSVPSAHEGTRGFEVAVTWYAPEDQALRRWTKRVMILATRKAAGLFREPGEEDRRIIAGIKETASGLPVSSAGRDGEFTLPVDTGGAAAKAEGGPPGRGAGRARSPGAP
jgi:hypothetical protein